MNVFQHSSRILILATVVFIMLLTGCGQNNAADYSLDSLSEEGLLLNKWQVIGPFPANGKSNSINTDNLVQFGFSERDITYNYFRKMIGSALKVGE